MRIRTNDLSRSALHNVQTIRVQTWETKQLRNALQEHHDDWQRDTADPFLYTPSIDDHACRYDSAQEPQTAAETVFGFTMTSDANVLLDDVICVSAAEEGAEEVPTTGGDVEERALEWTREVEAWIEDVTDRSEEGVHVPDQ